MMRWPIVRTILQYWRVVITGIVLKDKRSRMWREEGNIFNLWRVKNILTLFGTHSRSTEKRTTWLMQIYRPSNVVHKRTDSSPVCLSWLKKRVPYFLLLSCDSTVCNLWKISGGMKGGGALPSSDMTLRSLLIVGLLSLSESIGVSAGATGAAEGKTETMA